MAVRCAQVNSDGVARAGHGDGADAGDRLFDAIIDSASGVVTTDDTWDETLRRLKTSDGLVHVDIPELLGELASLTDEVPPGGDAEWPLILSAGERRAFTANTNFRDPAWRKQDPDGALRISPHDAERIGLADGDSAKLSTRRASAVVKIAVDESMHPGHVAVPNGLGVDHVESGSRVLTGLRAERADQHRGPRPVGRHPVAQVRAGPARAGLILRRA